MIGKKTRMVGFTCSYTPVQLIEAAGFVPYRVLPVSDVPDQAGRMLHDNVCPHVKRVLDRAISGDLPDLAGMVFLNSCDAMRRLAVAWTSVRPNDRVLLLDLPVTDSDASISWFSSELRKMSEVLGEWRGSPVEAVELERSVRKYNDASGKIREMQQLCFKKKNGFSAEKMQRIYNACVTSPIDEWMEKIPKPESLSDDPDNNNDGVPVYFFGNLFPDPEMFRFLSSCGVKPVGEDSCTGSRMTAGFHVSGDADPFDGLARAYLSRAMCARTFDPGRPLGITDKIIDEARRCQAKGVIGYTVKFCDPYLSRFPGIRKAMKENGIPLLLLEGDLTSGSIGQQRTRIEAFVEMLG